MRSDKLGRGPARQIAARGRWAQALSSALWLQGCAGEAQDVANRLGQDSSLNAADSLEAGATAVAAPVSSALAPAAASALDAAESPQPPPPDARVTVASDTGSDPTEQDASLPGAATTTVGLDASMVDPGLPPTQPTGVTTPVCGDGVVDANEGCDDGNVRAGDGCSVGCHLEREHTCEGEPSVCSFTTCGDGLREGTETCEDGNRVPFDGCSPECLKEPECTGSSCTSQCGDGLVTDEDCDDGNTIAGDGCSATCQIEPGFTCSQDPMFEQVNGQDVLRVPAVFRDFSGDHPDFDVTCDGLVTGVTETELNSAARPVLRNGSAACIQDAASFDQWFTLKLTLPAFSLMPSVCSRKS